MTIFVSFSFSYNDSQFEVPHSKGTYSYFYVALILFLSIFNVVLLLLVIILGWNLYS